MLCCTGCAFNALNAWQRLRKCWPAAQCDSLTSKWAPTVAVAVSGGNSLAAALCKQQTGA